MPFIRPRLAQKQVESIWQEAASTSLPAQECYSCGYKGGEDGTDWKLASGGATCPECGSYEVHLSSLGSKKVAAQKGTAVAKESAWVYPVPPTMEKIPGIDSNQLSIPEDHADVASWRGARSVQPGTVANRTSFQNVFRPTYFGGPVPGVGVWKLSFDPSSEWCLAGNWDIYQDDRDYHWDGNALIKHQLPGETVTAVGGWA